jgi:outer membrane biosynthesis protein TonB
MPNHARIHVAIRPALVAVALLFSSSTLPAQHVRRTRASDTPLVPLTTRWPSRTSIAALSPDHMTPLTVEATSDGWVIITPLSLWRERDSPPSERLRVTPEDLEAWTTAARHLGPELPNPSGMALDRPMAQLGRGQIHLAPRVRRFQGSFSLEIVGCDDVNVGIGMMAEDFDRFTAVLERAAAVARRSTTRRSRPTLARPYYASEVSCAARPVQASVAPEFPASIPPHARRYTEVGVRFIVDTAGFVEPRSLAFLPGTPAAFARAARAVVRGWHFRPAESSGLPVRQVVTTVVAFDPADVATRDDPDRVLSLRRNGARNPFRVESPRPPLYVQRDGGWVRVAMGHWRPDGTFDGYQEWLAPDSVDAWVAHATQLLAADFAQPKFPRSTFENGKGPGFALYPEPASSPPTRPGNPLTVQYYNGWSSDTQRIRLVARMSGCGGGSGWPAADIDRRMLERLTLAARDARAHSRSEPSAERTYRRGEVACAAFLPAVSSRQPMPAGLWHYPRAPYPAELSRENVRAEVLTSFEVDSLGAPIAATLQVAPGSDPRAVAALRRTIDRVRFEPAARAGARVRNRVVRTWLFEPPSLCANEEDGIDCARQYGRAP